jgi:hypothetical protein
MKKLKSFSIVLISFILLSAWTSTQMNEIEKAEWLIGTWEMKRSKGSIYESWEKASDNEFQGKSYMIKELDTIVFEHIQLVEEQEGLIYIPTVTNQNEGLPVRYAAKTITETQLVFENSEHDFPKQISYTLISPDSLVAEISGIKNGEERKQLFKMSRVE